MMQLKSRRSASNQAREPVDINSQFCNNFEAREGLEFMFQLHGELAHIQSLGTVIYCMCAHSTGEFQNVHLYIVQ